MAAGLAIPHGRTQDPGLIGREPEVAEIGAFIAATAGAPAALVIVGDVGIGKTSVWRHAVRAASRTHRVLSCRPASAEAPLAFSALDDLFGGVLEEIIPGLPEARGRALAVALRGWHSEPVAGGQGPGMAAGGQGQGAAAGGQGPSVAAGNQGMGAASGDPSAAASPGLGSSPGRGGHAWPEPRVLARAVLDGLRMLSRDTPVLLAVDDAQWPDRPSAAVLEFCIRRREQAAVSILLTLRGEVPVFPLGLEQALSPGSLACAQLGGVSPGAIAAILRSRLGVTFPRSTLRRLYDACGGNPLYALESGRALLARGRACAAGEPIPLPPGIGDLVRPRLRGLSPDALRVGRLIAASADPREQVIRAAHGDQDSWAAMDEVIDDGLIRRDSDALRFTHPLLGPVLYAEMTMSERRDVHRRLARSAGDVEERAWHLALGADGPAGEIAGLLDAAARHAAARGAPETAAVLAEQAIRMTPSRPSPGGPARILRAADYHFRAGEIGRSRELVESALTGCPAGSGRAALLIRQATVSCHQSGWAQAEGLFHQAALEAARDPELRAHAEGELALARLAAGDLPAASRWAAVALGSAEQAGRPRLLAHSLARLATEALALAEKSGNVPLASSALAVLGFIAVSLGDYPAAHRHLDRLTRLVTGGGLDQPGVVKFLPDEIEALAALGETSLAQAHLRRLHARGRALGRPWALATAA